jgi:hypothetical protein
LFIQILGTPTLKELSFVNPKNPALDLILKYPPHPGKIITNFKEVKGRNFEELFPNASADAIDLLKKMLRFNPVLIKHI